MLGLLTSVLLAMPAQDATKDMAAAAQKLIDAESYSFEMVSEGDLGRGRGGRRGGEAGGGAGGEGGEGGRPDRQPPGGGAAVGTPGGGATGGPVTTNGHFQKAKPMHAKTSDVEFYKLGESTVYKATDGTWKALERGGRAPGGGGAGGVAPPEAGGGEGGRRGGDRAGMMTRIAVQSVRFPHELLSNLEANVKGCACEEKDGKKVYTATLSDKGAEELSGAARMREMAERGGQAVEISASGTMTLTANSSGVVEEIHLDVAIKGPMGESKRTAKIKVNQIGATKIEVPAEVESLIKT